ncbi:MAG: T9SS type A sorting domain-containing protein [Saprospiraceae bacterium]|nr:T9SS type A sorting domain-containing protein [Saprospiraceae bacterium]MBP7699144.1 T9SS type A sorting domain-containing protein [Saprospiraceae bacterium]
MKSLNLLIFLLLAQQSWAQSTNENAHWDQAFFGLAGYFPVYLYTCGDTVINNETYQAVYQGIIENNTIIQSNYVGAIRYEGNKIYGYYYTVGEKLVYDFDLQDGQSIIIYSWIEGMDVTMTVDDISIINGRKHIKFQQTEFQTGPEVWISGIGSNFGFFDRGFQFMFSDYNPFLQCFKQNDEVIKITEDSTYTCTFYDLPEICGTSSIRQPNYESVTVYPNPASENVRLSLPTGYYEISVMNTLGQSLFYQKHFLTSEVIPTQNLPNGMYAVQVKNSTKQYTGIFIIQH